jgi:hypothetical protein
MRPQISQTRADLILKVGDAALRRSPPGRAERTWQMRASDNSFRRLTLRSATGTAQRAVPTNQSKFLRNLRTTKTKRTCHQL